MGGSDCGLFAIAVATSLCCGVLPQECFWDQRRMRKHLCDCFDKGVMFEFPKWSKPRHHKGCRHKESIQIVCHWKQPYFGKQLMVQCDKCHEQFHCECETVHQVVGKMILSSAKTVCNVILILVVIVLEDYILVKMGWHCALG